MKILVFSSKKSEKEAIGWVRDGANVNYSCNVILRVLQFSLQKLILISHRSIFRINFTEHYHGNTNLNMIMTKFSLLIHIHTHTLILLNFLISLKMMRRKTSILSGQPYVELLLEINVKFSPLLIIKNLK